MVFEGRKEGPMMGGLSSSHHPLHPELSCKRDPNASPHLIGDGGHELLVFWRRRVCVGQVLVNYRETKLVCQSI